MRGSQKKEGLAEVNAIFSLRVFVDEVIFFGLEYAAVYIAALAELGSWLYHISQGRCEMKFSLCCACVRSLPGSRNNFIRHFWPNYAFNGAENYVSAVRSVIKSGRLQAFKVPGVYAGGDVRGWTQLDE